MAENLWFFGSYARRVGRKKRHRKNAWNGKLPLVFGTVMGYNYSHLTMRR